jgi:hypothetical protein
MPSLLSSPLHTRTLRMKRHYYLFTDRLLASTIFERGIWQLAKVRVVALQLTLNLNDIVVGQKATALLLTYSNPTRSAWRRRSTSLAEGLANARAAHRL